MKTVGAILCVILVASVLFAIGHQQEACEAKNGTLVRGVFWYTCVGEKP